MSGPSRSGTGLLCLVVFASTVCVGAFGPLLPEIARAQGLPDWQLGVLAGSFGFARMAADLPAGALATRRLATSLTLPRSRCLPGCFFCQRGAVYGCAGPAPDGLSHTLVMVGSLTAVLQDPRAARLHAPQHARVRRHARGPRRPRAGRPAPRALALEPDPAGGRRARHGVAGRHARADPYVPGPSRARVARRRTGSRGGGDADPARGAAPDRPAHVRARRGHGARLVGGEPVRDPAARDAGVRARPRRTWPDLMAQIVDRIVLYRGLAGRRIGRCPC